MTGPIRVGVQLPEVERDVRWPELLAMARAAEDVGFDSVWVGDHLLYRGDGRPERGPWDAWTLLSAVAASTGPAFGLGCARASRRHVTRAAHDDPPTTGANPADSSAVTRDGTRFTTSSARAAAQPKRAYRGER